MPRKPNFKKQTITVVVNGTPIAVVLHPPSGSRKSWYAFWTGLATSKSTGQAKLEDAIVAAESMVRNGGRKSDLTDMVLSDEEIKAIQGAYFNRKTDPAARERARKTLDDCLEAIDAFKAISGLERLALAKADDCATFQRKALTLPKNWRRQYPKSKKEVEPLSPNTIIKWSRSLRAAFERVNRNAGRRCVRGVVNEQKLLTDNPWKQFTWIEGTRRPIRQFDAGELLSLLEYLESKWGGVTAATTVAKVFLWSWGRRAEITSLSWSSLRAFDGEYHFEIVCKWGVEKWFRVPETLYRELLQIKTNSPFVFAAYNEQLRAFYERTGRRPQAHHVGSEFKPVNFGDWFHERIVEWSKTLARGRATTHVFRKTSLQYARCGEDLNRLIAADARLSEGVMMKSYVKETDEQMRQKSNRTYARILASVDTKVARRYGHTESSAEQLKKKIQEATAIEDWKTAAVLMAKLAEQKPLSTTG